MRRLFLAVLAVLALAGLASAQSTEIPTQTATFMHKYDVDSTNLTYCVLADTSGNPFGAPKQSEIPIKTTGSSATVAAVTGSTLPFASLSVGDTILVQDTSFVNQELIVIAKASGDSITVDKAVNLGSSRLPWRWLKQTCGTADTDGWINVLSAKSVAITSQFDQGDIANLVVRWECKTAGVGAQPIIVYPGESSDCGIGGSLATDRCLYPVANVGITSRLTVVISPNPYAFCRLGVAYTVSDTSDAAANIEQVTGTISLVR